MDFVKILREQSERLPQKPAIIFGEERVSFTQLRDFSFQAAAGLAALKLGKADKVAIFLPNVPEYIFSFLGIFSLRGIAVPLDFMLTEEEVINFLNHSESTILIAQEKKGIDLARIKQNCPYLKEIIVFGGNCAGNFLPWRDFLGNNPAPPEIEANDADPAAIFYTSGSTGHPKGVLLSYGHLKNPIETLEYFIQPTDADSYICAGVPFSHVGGLDYLLFMLYFGSTLALLERFYPLEFLKNIERHKITIFCIVPSMYVAVLSLKEYDKFDLSSLRYAVVFGAPSSPVLL